MTNTKLSLLIKISLLSVSAFSLSSCAMFQSNQVTKPKKRVKTVIIQSKVASVQCPDGFCVIEDAGKSVNVATSRYSTIKSGIVKEQINPLIAIGTFNFNQNTRTIKEAVNQILLQSGYSLDQQESKQIQVLLNQNLASSQRNLLAMSAIQAMHTLLGDEINIEQNRLIRKVRFSVKKSYNGKIGYKPIKVKKDKYSHLVLKHSLINGQTVNQKAVNQQLIDALKLAYQFRIAAPLNIKQEKKQTIVDAILAYNSKHHLAFEFNNDGKIVGVAKSDKEAKALSHTQRDVFYVFADQTMQETIKRWASYEHIDVIYQGAKDFKILQPATIYGTFTSTDGALATLLGSIQNSSYPLKATFMKNNLLLIQPSTYSSNFEPKS